MPVSFSVEECCSKCVDLHDIHREYSNLRFNFDINWFLSLYVSTAVGAGLGLCLGLGFA